MTSDFEAVRRQLTNTTVGVGGSNDSEVIRDTLRLYGSIFLCLFLAFCFLRQWFPRFYNVRSWAPRVKTELADEQYGLIDWIWKVWRVSSDEIRDECGLDALCYLRVLQFGFRLSCIGAFNSIWLLPVYSTAEDSIETLHVIDGMAQVSVGNVPPGSTRFLGTVMAAYIFFGCTMYFILKEFQWFTTNRHHFLASFSPRNYSVYVQNIPKEYRSSGDLLLFFRRVFSTEAVLQAHVALDIPELDKKVSQRSVLVSKLEHAIAIKNIIETNPDPDVWKNMKGQDRLIHSYKKDLEELNLFISEAVETHKKRRRPKLPSKSSSAPSSRRSSRHLKLLLMPRSSSHRKKHGSSSSIGKTRSTICSTNSSLIEEDETLPLKSSLQKHQDVSAAPSKLDDKRKNMMKPLLFGEDTECGSARSRSSSLSKLSDKTGSSIAIEDGNVHLHSRPQKGHLGDTESLVEDESMHTIHEGDFSRPQKGQLGDAESLVEDDSMHTIHEGDFSSINNDDMGFRSLAGKEETTTAQHEDNSHAVSIIPGKAKTMKQPAGLSTAIFKFLSTASSKAAHVSVSVASQAKNSAARLTLLGKGEDGRNRDAGFVTFTSLRCVHTVIQNIQHADPFVLDITPAPEPSAIFWDNVGKSVHQVQVGKLISILLSVALCLFWTLPVTFIVSLTQVESLKGTLSFLARWVERWPWIEDLLALIAPLVLILLNTTVLPLLLKSICRFELPVSESTLESSSFVKMTSFVIIQTFFVSTVSGTITAELTNILKNPKLGVDFLATSLPGRSTYFLQLLTISTFLGVPFELLRVFPLAQVFIRSRASDNLTERERNRTIFGLRPLSDPFHFQFARVFSGDILYFMVLFVYSSLAPIVPWFVGLFFLLMGSCYRYNFIHNYPKTADSGGQLWISFVKILMTCMIVAEVTIIGFLALKKSTLAVPFMLPLIGATVLFNIFVRQRHFRISENLPAYDCLNEDNENLENDVDFNEFKDKYLQPSLLVPIVEPDWDSR